MKKTSMIKAMLGVFNSYGIALTGKKKHAHFYHQLRMDKVYVFGLVYELENLAGVAIEEDWGGISTPSELMSRLLRPEAWAAASSLPVTDNEVPVMV
jgi:hypothetical protein